MDKYTYEDIKDCIVFSFEEYFEYEGYNSSQATARTFEEEWRVLNKSLFNKTCFYILIAIESLKNDEIADFIIESIDKYININIDEFRNLDVDMKDIIGLSEDIEICKKLLKEKKFKIIKNNVSSKSRIDYILGLESE